MKDTSARSISTQLHMTTSSRELLNLLDIVVLYGSYWVKARAVSTATIDSPMIHVLHFVGHRLSTYSPSFLFRNVSLPTSLQFTPLTSLGVDFAIRSWEQMERLTCGWTGNIALGKLLL